MVTPCCKHCHRLIYSDRVGIWRHFSGLMLCQPHEGESGWDPNNIAEPVDA